MSSANPDHSRASEALVGQSPVSSSGAAVDPVTRKARLRATVASFQSVLSPLLAAIYEVQAAIASEQGQAEPTGSEASTEGGGDVASALSPASTAQQLSILVESTVMLVQGFVQQAELNGESNALRIGIASGASQAVAAFYRATGRPLDPTKDMPNLLAALKQIEQRLASLIVTPGEDSSLTLPAFRNSLIEALTPAVGAVAQYAFGRPEHGLLAEVGEKIMQKCEQVTRALAPAGASPDEWRQLCGGVLKAAGQLYADCHYAEADRLLYMNPEERESYFAQHGNKVPMTRVWQGFDQRMALLATLIAYIEIPEPAQAGGNA